jgi:hypothetical protein
MAVAYGDMYIGTVFIVWKTDSVERNVVLWVAYATHSTLKPDPTLPR